MKKNYIMALVLCLGFIIITYLVGRINGINIVDVKQVFNNNIDNSFTIRQTNEETDTYKISIYYPETKYPDLNININEMISKKIDEFKEQVSKSNNEKENFKYNLSINFTKCEYENFVSFVFEIFLDLGGAHPNTNIVTINYDVKSNKIIDINSLMEKNNKIIDIFSDYSYNELKNNDKIKQNINDNMLKEGTLPKKENFSNFVFDIKGIRLYFQNYAVAPYYKGSFEVIIPYDKINI